ncbi:MAG: protoglobin domain-containing protein [Thiolinea sp.]
MEKSDYEALCVDARTFARLNEENIHILHAIGPDIRSKLPEVTEKFYQHLLSIPRVQPYLDGRLEQLRLTHDAWLTELFSARFDAEYAEKIYAVGDVHGKVQLPAEFMAGAMSIIQGYLIGVLREVYTDQPETLLESVLAINAALGFSLYIMQESYQTSAVDNELERFLAITGMSRNLFENLAKAYR